MPNAANFNLEFRPNGYWKDPAALLAVGHVRRHQPAGPAKRQRNQVTVLAEEVAG
jgi:hypothetical protein